MLIRQLLTKNLPFVVYCLPGEREPVFLVQTSQQVQQFPLEELEQQQGFVIATFDVYQTGKAYLIKTNLISHNTQEAKELSDKINLLPDKAFQLPEGNNFIISRKNYLRDVKKVVSRIKKGEAQKVVLSRVVEKSVPSEFNIDLFFDSLKQKYPTAFVYLFHLPGEGIWTGATPEILLKRNGNFYETMALAGTQKRTSDDKPLYWEEKEKKEQAFVTDFVEEQIRETGIKIYKKQPVETVLAGNLAHLCTRFHFPAGTLPGKTGRFVKALHPTPAVCGLPKEKAWQLISETEKHKRLFYTGFLGPWKMENTASLFVNLRCARFLKDKFELYVGGGLTAASSPQKEWQETEDKSATLLSVLEKMRNFAP
ncbi:Isochorismate synthase @ Menaquinone-specific isochorismate synthase [hydrothermal vent metagenome]|uniref:isochorismate synthase n=1 Tax=hydrothermal vent metagenome TaxID=652676 RepID=A0A3B0V643_9ZZZZ